MRRRVPDAEEAARAMGIEQRMYRWNPADWPDACHPECAFFAAWSDWHHEHPESDANPASMPTYAPFHPELI